MQNFYETFFSHGKCIGNSQSWDPVQKLVKSLFQLFNLEPVGVECHHVRCLILFIVAEKQIEIRRHRRNSKFKFNSPWKILLQPFEHFITVMIVQYTLVEIRTNSTLVWLNKVRIQRNLPDFKMCTWKRIFFRLIELERENVINKKLTAREWFCGTCSRLAFMRNFIIECVWPDGNFVWWNDNGRVVNEAKVFNDLILCVSTGLQERCTHTVHVWIWNRSKVSQNLSHTNHFANPFLESFILQTLLQTDCLYSYLVAVEREILDLLVIAEKGHRKKRDEFINMAKFVRYSFVFRNIHTHTQPHAREARWIISFCCDTFLPLF